MRLLLSAMLMFTGFWLVMMGTSGALSETTYLWVPGAALFLIGVRIFPAERIGR